MYILPIDRRSTADISLLQGANFTLDTSGVAGVFGGELAVSAMGTVPFYSNRRWFGWYNCPGSYEIAKQYGKLAQTTFFNGVFPGSRSDPATFFEMDGLKGPAFRAIYSRTAMSQTGHVAALFENECAAMQGTPIEGRSTQPVSVTIAELNHIPEFKLVLGRSRSHSLWLACIPILVSIATCAACSFARDWFCFTLILFGMLASGTSCAVLGSGTFSFSHPEPAQGSPRGDGILISDKGVVLLRGEEGAVNSITRGTFNLHFSSAPMHRDIGWCSVLLMIQFIVQLLLILQGTLFGQLMFVTSLAVSWAYNAWLSSIDKERIQREILKKDVLKDPKLTQFTLGTRTTMAVFVLLVSRAADPENIIDYIIPNDTPVWLSWKATIVERLKSGEPLTFKASLWEDRSLSNDDRDLLKNLYADAAAAYKGFSEHCCPHKRISS